MEEKRQTVRVDINVGIRLRTDAQETARKALSTRAFNAEGIQLLLASRIPPKKEEVELEIQLPGQPTPLKASGQVAWVEHRGDVYEGYYAVGIQFLELPDSARQVIERLITEQLSTLKPLSSEGG